jgi:AcrR family transcriptional regulator
MTRIRLAAGTAAVGTAACLLGAGCVVWASAPLVHQGFANLALFLAIVGVAAGALRLALADVPVPEDSYLLPSPLRVWLRFLQTLRLVPWEEGALIAVVWLEVLHPSRPRHTAVLGAALIAYLLAVHLAESGASPRVLRPQVRVLAAGAGLLALGAAAGMLPASGPGAGSALLRLVAAGALIAAAGLVLPYVARQPGT